MILPEKCTQKLKSKLSLRDLTTPLDTRRILIIGFDDENPVSILMHIFRIFRDLYLQPVRFIEPGKTASSNTNNLDVMG